MVKSYGNYTITVPIDTIITVKYLGKSGFFVDDEMARKQIKKMLLSDTLLLQEKRYLKIIENNNEEIENYKLNEETLKSMLLYKDELYQSIIKKKDIENKKKFLKVKFISISSTVGTIALSLFLLLRAK